MSHCARLPTSHALALRSQPAARVAAKPVTVNRPEAHMALFSPSGRLMSMYEPYTDVRRDGVQKCSYDPNTLQADVSWKMPGAAAVPVNPPSFMKSAPTVPPLETIIVPGVIEAYPKAPWV